MLLQTISIMSLRAEEDASWPMFCGHVLGALIDYAPNKVRLQIAADAHAGLKGAAAAAAATATAAAATASITSEEDEDQEDEVSTSKAAAFVVEAIYGRLEAARQAVMEQGHTGRLELGPQETGGEVAIGSVAAVSVST